MRPFIDRICIAWVVIFAVFLGKAQLATLLFGPDYRLDRHIFMAVLTSALVVPLIVMMRRHVDREPLAYLGLAMDRSAARPLFIGALAWLGPFAVGLAACLGLGLVEIRALASWGEILAFVPLLVVLVFLLEALPEELAFRGYLQTNLGRIVEPWLAVGVQALLFGSWGVAIWLVTAGGIDPAQASLFYVMGVVLGMLRVITGSLWTSIGFHLAFQTVAQLLLNSTRGHFEVDGLAWLQFIAMGALPFGLAITIVGHFYRGRVDWEAKPA